MEQEKKQTKKKQEQGRAFLGKRADDYSSHPFILEEVTDSAISFINKLIWALFGILSLAIVIASFRSLV